MNINIKKQNKLFTIILFLIIIFAMTFSEFFIYKNLYHHLEEHDHNEECATCIIIEQSKNIIKNVLKNTSVAFAILLLADNILFIKKYICEIVLYTLVNEKVRLND